MYLSGCRSGRWRWFFDGFQHFIFFFIIFFFFFKNSDDSFILSYSLQEINNNLLNFFFLNKSRFFYVEWSKVNTVLQIQLRTNPSVTKFVNWLGEGQCFSLDILVSATMSQYKHKTPLLLHSYLLYTYLWIMLNQF